MTKQNEKESMRIIKFHAWDKKRKKILLWGHLISNDVIDVFDNPNLILMQYTGLKDKNGKEIYEGDIIKNYTNNDIFLMEWVSVLNGYDFTGWVHNDYGGCADLKNWEVIGNIYENPELFNQQP